MNNWLNNLSIDPVSPEINLSHFSLAVFTLTSNYASYTRGSVGAADNFAQPQLNFVVLLALGGFVEEIVGRVRHECLLTNVC